jgi:hypothetical protein
MRLSQHLFHVLDEYSVFIIKLTVATSRGKGKGRVAGGRKDIKRNQASETKIIPLPNLPISILSYQLLKNSLA